MNLLTADQLGEVLERTRQDLFRIETLPSYDTAMTTGDFRRWLEGETEPTWEVRNRGWTRWRSGRVRGGRAAGSGSSTTHPATTSGTPVTGATGTT